MLPSLMQSPLHSALKTFIKHSVQKAVCHYCQWRISSGNAGAVVALSKEEIHLLLRLFKPLLSMLPGGCEGRFLLFTFYPFLPVPGSPFHEESKRDIPESAVFNLTCLIASSASRTSLEWCASSSRGMNEVSSGLVLRLYVYLWCLMKKQFYEGG